MLLNKNNNKSSFSTGCPDWKMCTKPMGGTAEKYKQKDNENDLHHTQMGGGLYDCHCMDLRRNNVHTVLGQQTLCGLTHILTIFTK